MTLYLDDLPDDVRVRFARLNPEAAHELLARATEAETPVRRRYVPHRVKPPTEAEQRAFDRAQARCLEAIEELNEAYLKRNTALLSRSTETAKIVVALLALVILLITAFGAAGPHGG